MWAAIALSFGLAMDATAVSAARGLAPDRREVVILPLLFGAFQSGMSALGWLGGKWVGTYIARWDTWVAFGLLLAIGGKMIFEALRVGEDGERPPGSWPLYLGLAVATSVDAAAAGLTLPVLQVDPWIAITLIGVVTLVCSVVGFAFGRAIGRRWGSKLEILGGLVLVGIAIDTLIRGL